MVLVLNYAATRFFCSVVSWARTAAKVPPYEPELQVMGHQLEFVSAATLDCSKPSDG